MTRGGEHRVIYTHPGRAASAMLPLVDAAKDIFPRSFCGSEFTAVEDNDREAGVALSSTWGFSISLFFLAEDLRVTLLLSSLPLSLLVVRALLSPSCS